MLLRVLLTEILSSVKYIVECNKVFIGYFADLIRMKKLVPVEYWSKEKQKEIAKLQRDIRGKHTSPMLLGGRIKSVDEIRREGQFYAFKFAESGKEAVLRARDGKLERVAGDEIYIHKRAGAGAYLIKSGRKERNEVVGVRVFSSIDASVRIENNGFIAYLYPLGGKVSYNGRIKGK